ncbi:MAG: ribosome-associated translation inhibitor RaiA [Candidatus Abyssobacteria bacterium SURF_17]|uniref:Ribosome hibernation promoting factor n=1 Tax=Candidatus Abyssobacteria bacterium SURF_17 TaxID=2093361 RepID=A0A419EWD6_9BACT|nr:MAG: ribosome-associated translation inhibitor RaiA [Candidatus Abyssubacteria bacterium SURF_17]
MELTVTGRHVEITEPIRSHIEKKLQKVLSSFDRITDVRVVLSVEKYRQFAEITVSGGNSVRFHSQEATDDMYVSIDKAVEKIQRQLRTRVSKARRAKRKKSEEPAAAAQESDEGAPEPEELLEQHGQYSVSVSTHFGAKPMSVEDAVMQIEASGDVFFAFVNERSNDVNVVYRKKDGGYGLLRRTF